MDTEAGSSGYELPVRSLPTSATPPSLNTDVQEARTVRGRAELECSTESAQLLGTGKTLEAGQGPCNCRGDIKDRSSQTDAVPSTYSEANAVADSEVGQTSRHPPPSQSAASIANTGIQVGAIASNPSSSAEENSSATRRAKLVTYKEYQLGERGSQNYSTIMERAKIDKANGLVIDFG